MNRREALITSGLLLVLCLLIAVIVVARRDPFSNPSTADGPPPTTVTVPPDGPAVDDDLATFVDEAMAFIESRRGVPFAARPEVVVLSDADFVDRVDADLSAEFAEDPDALAVLNAQYRSTALIGPDERIDEVVRRFGEVGILGFYDPETDELVVREADGLSLLTKTTIVHELVHAYDDQRFDLHRPEYDDDPGEIGWTFRAVVEGSATWLEEEWQATLGAADRQRLMDEELAFGDVDILSQFELAFLLVQLSPYEAGEPFVEAIVESGGVDALDEVLEVPPVSSEQVLEVDRFRTGEPPIAIGPPPADDEALWRGTGGQALIEALFVGNFVGSDVSWGGDQMVVWVDDGGQSCFRWDLAADSTAGLEALAVGFRRWGNAVGATVVSSPDDDTVRVERCA